MESNQQQSPNWPEPAPKPGWRRPRPLLLVLAALLSIASVGAGVAIAGAGQAPSVPSSWRLLSSATATPHDPIYLFLDKIPGEVTQSGHMDWIELSSWRWAAANTVSASKPSVSRFVVTTFLSRATPVILSQLLLHTRIDRAVIEFLRPVAGGLQVYLRLELRNVLITGWNQTSSGDQPPLEQITFTFDRIKYIYTYQGRKGIYTFCWQVIQQRAC